MKTHAVLRHQISGSSGAAIVACDAPPVGGGAPESATLLLFGSGLTGLAYRRFSASRR